MYLERAVSTPFLKRLTVFARTTLSGNLFQVLATLLEKAFSLSLNLACCLWILKVFPLVPLSVPGQGQAIVNQEVKFSSSSMEN